MRELVQWAKDHISKIPLSTIYRKQTAKRKKMIISVQSSGYCSTVGGPVRKATVQLSLSLYVNYSKSRLIKRNLGLILSFHIFYAVVYNKENLSWHMSYAVTRDTVTKNMAPSEHIRGPLQCRNQNALFILYNIGGCEKERERGREKRRRRERERQAGTGTSLLGTAQVAHPWGRPWAL